jgi:predicted nucleic acid-binding protein
MNKIFMDTNIIIYANDGADPRKQELAIDIVTGSIRDGLGVISTQVMQEYAVNAIGKLRQALPVVMHQLHLLETLETVLLKPALVRRALEICGIYRISYWDALIVAAAEHAGCSRILSEDLNAGQFYCGIECVNPFQQSPATSA